MRHALNAPQPMWLWPGMCLLGCVPMEKHGIRNGVAYTVDAVDKTLVHLKESPKLTLQDVVQMLRLGYAMTYASVQSRETEGTLCLHDTDTPHFTMRHLYVGLSRAKKAADVRVE